MSRETTRVFTFAEPWSYAWPWMRTLLLETAAGFRKNSDQVTIVFAKKLVTAEELQQDFPNVREACNKSFGKAHFAYSADDAADAHSITIKTSGPLFWGGSNPLTTKILQR